MVMHMSSVCGPTLVMVSYNKTKSYIEAWAGDPHVNPIFGKFL